MSPSALRSPGWLGEFAAGAHCDGVEYMPMFDMLPGHTPAAIGRAVAKGELKLNSLHATFREGQNSADTNKLPGDPGAENPSLKGRIIGSPLGRLILPEVCESADVMNQIQLAANRCVPVVLYPQADAEKDRRQIEAAHSLRHLFQPTDHVARLVGAANIVEFDEETSGVRGYDYVIDTFHLRRRYGRDEPGVVSDFRTSVPYMAPNTSALHLSLNRTDIPGEPHIPTEAEARKALKGVYDGELKEMLDVVKETGFASFVVIEATSNGIADLTGHKSMGDIQSAYADIADGFREYWAA